MMNKSKTITKLTGPVLAMFAVVGIAVGAQMMNGVANSAEEAKPLKAGAPLPNPTVMNLDGKKVSLKSVLGKKPSVVIFYRGGWCPFCNRQLGDLARYKDELAKKGYQVIAISPDQPQELKKTMEKNAVTYTLVSDFNADAMKQFGVAWKAPDEMVNTYKEKYKVDLEQYSGAKHHVLPVPSVYVINAKGQITFAHANPDYRVRLDGKQIIAAIDAN